MDLRDMVFRLRGFTPVPFLLVSVLWAKPNALMIVTGAILCIAGEWIRIQALRHAGGATRTRNVGAPKLVSSGPYARVRNPLYLANVMLYTGFGVASSALLPYLPVLILIYFSWQYGMIISLEEGTLRKLFGEAYAEYCRRVPRLFPRLTGGSDGSNNPDFSLVEALREERSTLMGLMLAWMVLILRIIYLPLIP